MNTKPIRLTCVALSILTLALIGLGGYVRGTGAGLACPDWPLCFGRVIPEMEGGVIQEFSHRALAGLVSILTLVLFVQAIRARKTFPRLWKVVSWLLVLLACQVVLGGLTVLMQLNSFIVTGHLVMGTLFFQIVTLIAIERRSLPLYGNFDVMSDKPRSFVLESVRRGRKFTQLVGLAVALLFAQICLGGFVASSGASMACGDIPFCSGFFENGMQGPQIVQVLHRLMGVLIFFVGIGLLLRTRHTPGLPSARRGHLFGINFLIFTQIIIGFANVYFMIPVHVAVTHLVIAQLILLGLASLYKDLNPQLSCFWTDATEAQLTRTFIQERKVSTEERRVIGIK